MKARGTLSHKHRLKRRNQVQSLIRQEATKVSDQEMEMQKSSYSRTLSIEMPNISLAYFGQWFFSLRKSGN